MTTRTQSHRRWSVVSALLGGSLVFVTPHPTSAQARPADARWQAWLGCWATALPSTTRFGTPPKQVFDASVTGTHGAGQETTTGQIVCAIPGAGISAVDIWTLTDGKLASREHIEASGEQRQTERDGCKGWEMARWAPDARRVYLESEYLCSGSPKRSSSGLIAMTPNGEWLNVVGVTVGEANTGVRVARYRGVLPPATLPDDVASILRASGPAVSAARAAIDTPIDLSTIVEASRHLNPSVVEAWLSELGQPFAVDARRLRELAEARVPDRVIDVLVALSYPKAFAIRPSPNAVGSLVRGEERGSAGGVDSGDMLFDCGSFGVGFSLYGWGGCGLYGYSSWGYAPYQFAPYAYSPYYSGGPYGGWYLGNEPFVISLQPSNAAATHGQVVNGRGYVQGGNADQGSASQSSTPSSSSVSTPASSGSSGSNSGSSGGGSSSGGGDRTAQPR